MLNAKVLDLDYVEQINSVSNTPIDFTRLFYMLSQEMDHLIRHADTKAQLILGVDAVLIASSAQLAPGMAAAILDPNGSWIVRGAFALSVLMLVLLLGSIFYALFTVVPRVRKSHIGDNLYFFGSIAHMTEEDYTHRFLNMSMDQLKKTVIAQIHAKANIVQRKFYGVRLSVNFLFFAVMCWVLVRVMMAFT